jgi:hypothetical protein
MSARAESIDIHCEPQAVFDLFHDYDRRLQWDPFLKEARLLNGAVKAGQGVKAMCVARNPLARLAMQTIYISYAPPRVAAVQMVRGPWFLRSFAASLRHAHIAPGVTRVVYRYHFRARPVWLASMLNPMLAALFSWETRRRLQALKRALDDAGQLGPRQDEKEFMLH